MFLKNLESLSVQGCFVFFFLLSAKLNDSVTHFLTQHLTEEITVNSWCSSPGGLQGSGTLHSALMLRLTHTADKERDISLCFMTVKLS